MREILFRCWDKENSEFAYSNDDLDEVDFQFEGNYLVCYLLGWETDYLGEIQPKWVKLNEKVEHYTGLTDKNETKIFEGDIVEVLDGNYELEGFGNIVYFNGFWYVEGTVQDSLYDLWYNGKSFRVIGNIYDNPQLLEGENK